MYTTTFEISRMTEGELPSKTHYGHQAPRGLDVCQKRMHAEAARAEAALYKEPLTLVSVPQEQ